MAKAVVLPLGIPCAGKFGDLAGFTSAIILAMIALLIGYESVTRFFDPVPIHFEEAIPDRVSRPCGQYRKCMALCRGSAGSGGSHVGTLA